MLLSSPDESTTGWASGKSSIIFEWLYLWINKSFNCLLLSYLSTQTSTEPKMHKEKNETPQRHPEVSKTNREAAQKPRSTKKWPGPTSQSQQNEPETHWIKQQKQPALKLLQLPNQEQVTRVKNPVPTSLWKGWRKWQQWTSSPTGRREVQMSHHLFLSSCECCVRSCTDICDLHMDLTIQYLIYFSMFLKVVAVWVLIYLFAGCAWSPSVVLFTHLVFLVSASHGHPLTK